MRDIVIKTNHVPRDLIDGINLTAEEREEFDYHKWPAIDRGDESAEFFRYKGQLHDMSQFVRTSGVGALVNWQGYSADSAFSGLVVRYVDDGERVIVGWYMC